MNRCSICSQSFVPAFIKHGYHIVRCPGCDLYKTLLHQPYSQVIKAYYNKAYFTGSRLRAGYANYEEDYPVIQRNAEMFLNILSRFSKPGKLLDVGCATGIFLKTAEAFGFKGWGIDVSEYAAKLARQRLPGRIKQVPLSRNGFTDRYFDVITFLDVFEHLDNPRQKLALCRKLLKPKGLILINTGNTDSLMAKLQQQHWHYFIPPQHVYYYSRRNLTRLLLQSGFKIVGYQATGKFLSLRYLLHLMRTIDHSLPAKILYPLVARNFLGRLQLYINLRDNMTILARKI